MKSLITENQKLKLEIQNLKKISNDKYVDSSINRTTMNNHLREADEAMDRFSKKLEKENKKYAKQKQSKR